MAPYIMRHGKTDWNAKHKLQGRTDIPIGTRTSRWRQAKKNIKMLILTYAIAHRLSGAKQTAEIVLEGRNIPIV